MRGNTAHHSRPKTEKDATKPLPMYRGAEAQRRNVSIQGHKAHQMALKSPNSSLNSLLTV